MPAEPGPVLVVPMAGRGTRFRAAGETTPKPLLPVLGHPMLAHVAAAFPGIERIAIIAGDAFTAAERQFLRDGLGFRLVEIPPHADGPGASLVMAASALPVDRSWFVSYCDIAWRWGAKGPLEIAAGPSAVFTHTGFHPHLVGDNRSAFCRPDRTGGRLEEIREKASFTDHWLDEPVSIGLFFVRHGRDLIAAQHRLITENRRVSGEFYPSEAFNILRQAEPVALEAVPFYVHWGMPSHRDDVHRWRRVLQEPVPARIPGTRTVMLMAGSGSRMAAIGTEPKPLLPLLGEQLYRHVAARLPAEMDLVVTTPDLAARLPRGERVVVLDGPTASQLQTLRLSRPHLPRDGGILLASCDCYGLPAGPFDPAGADAAVFTFTPSPLQERMGGQHSHVTVRDGRAVAIHVKQRPDPEAPGLAGFFWLRDAAVLDALEAVPVPTDREPIADDFFAHLVDTGARVAAVPLVDYVHLGTAEEWREHEFWWRHRAMLGIGA